MPGRTFRNCDLKAYRQCKNPIFSTFAPSCLTRFITQKFIFPAFFLQHRGPFLLVINTMLFDQPRYINEKLRFSDFHHHFFVASPLYNSYQIKQTNNNAKTTRYFPTFPPSPLASFQWLVVKNLSSGLISAAMAAKLAKSRFVFINSVYTPRTIYNFWGGYFVPITDRNWKIH